MFMTRSSESPGCVFHLVHHRCSVQLDLSSRQFSNLSYSHAFSAATASHSSRSLSERRHTHTALPWLPPCFDQRLFYTIMAPTRRRNPPAVALPERSVAEHVRDRQRRVPEREASRLADRISAPSTRLGKSCCRRYVLMSFNASFTSCETRL
jgi:hypothetical protein